MESEASRLLPKECVELLEHLKSTTQRQTTSPEQNITTFGKFSIPSLLTFEPSPTRQLLIEARTNFEEGLLEFWNTGRLSKNSVELLASGFLAEPLVGATTTEMRTNIQHALLGFMKDHPNNDAAIALHGVFTMTSSSEKAVMLVETAFKLQGMARYAYMLSNLCLYLQRHADAIKWCTINIKRDPKCTCEYYSRGFAYMSMQKVTFAKKDFQVYLDNSTKEARKRAATYYQLAAISMSENDFRAMATYFHLGEQAELDCFPLYDSGDIGSKHLVGRIVKMQEAGMLKGKTGGKSDSKKGYEQKKGCCSACGLVGKGLKFCSQCGTVQYCSQPCQLEHWKAGHKQICNKK